MRAEALWLPRDGINAQPDPELVPEEPSERVAKLATPTTPPSPPMTTTAAGSNRVPAGWPTCPIGATSPPWLAVSRRSAARAMADRSTGPRPCAPRA